MVGPVLRNPAAGQDRQPQPDRDGRQPAAGRDAVFRWRASRNPRPIRALDPVRGELKRREAAGESAKVGTCPAARSDGKLSPLRVPKGSSMTDPVGTAPHGLSLGLTNYGDPDFALYLRRSFARSNRAGQSAPARLRARWPESLLCAGGGALSQLLSCTLQAISIRRISTPGIQVSVS